MHWFVRSRKQWLGVAKHRGTFEISHTVQRQNSEFLAEMIPLLFHGLCWYSRNTPIEKGLWRLQNYLTVVAKKMTFPPGESIITTRSGFRMAVHLSDRMGRFLYATGDYEPATSNLFRALVRPGDFVVDVGANVGFFSLLSATLAGKSGKVLAFEPVPPIRNQLLKNVSLNHMSQIECREEALSNQQGSVTLHIAPGHFGLTSMRAVENATEEIHAPMTLLDELLKNEPRKIQLIKIDVEGAELLALRGMKQRLVSDQPNLIVEVTDRFLQQLGDSEPSLLEYLRSLGYRLFIPDSTGCRELGPNETGGLAQYNLLASFNDCRQLQFG